MEKTLYPLTQSQNVVCFEMSFLPYKQIVNICVEFEFKSEIDKNLMLQAMNLAMMRNPNNYVRLIKKDKQMMQYFTEDALEKIEYIEFNDEETYQKSLKTLFETPFPNKQIEVPLYRIRLVKKPNGLFAIDGCFSHIIYDAYAIMASFKDICECYKALLNNTPIPTAAISPIKAYENDYAYEVSDRKKSDEEYIRNVLFKTEPQYTSFNGRTDKTFIPTARYGKFTLTLKMAGDMLNLEIDKDIIEAVDKYAKENKVTAETVYFLALRSYLAYVNEVDDVTIHNTIGRRMTVAQKKAGGTMANGVLVRTDYSNDISYKEALNQCFASIFESYKHANFSMTNVTTIEHEMYVKSATKTYFSVYLTYQPDIFKQDDIEFSFLRYPNGKEVCNMYISIMPSDSKGNYVVNYSYQSEFITKETVKKYHEFMMAFTKEALNNDQLSINEIIKRVEK